MAPSANYRIRGWHGDEITLECLVCHGKTRLPKTVAAGDPLRCQAMRTHGWDKDMNLVKLESPKACPSVFVPDVAGAIAAFVEAVEENRAEREKGEAEEAVGAEEKK